MRSASWIQVVAAPPIPDSLRPFRLDRGEDAVLALALVPSEEETEVVLDDLAARRCAAAIGWKVRGSLSFLLIAKAEGRIPAVRSLLEELHRGGIRLSAELFRHILDLAGEYTPVRTEALRLEVQLQPEMSGGVLECRVP